MLKPEQYCVCSQYLPPKPPQAQACTESLDEDLLPHDRPRGEGLSQTGQVSSQTGQVLSQTPCTAPRSLPAALSLPLALRKARRAQAAPTPKGVQVPPRLLPAASPAGSPCFPSGSLPATPGSRGSGRAPQVRRGRWWRLAAGRGGGCRSGRGWGRGGGAGSRPPPFAGAAARGRAAAGCG